VYILGTKIVSRCGVKAIVRLAGA